MTDINHQRRKWLSLGGIMLGATLLPNCLLASVSTPKPRILKFRNINTGEKLNLDFIVGKGFSAVNLKKLDYLMRDRRTNQVHKIDPKLFTKLNHIHRQAGVAQAEILIICGYRAPATNAKMHQRSRGVASNSYHTRGQAIDFRLQGVSLAKVRQLAEGLKNGGVGYYPKSNFVHIDTGPVRSWRGS